MKTIIKKIGLIIGMTAAFLFVVPEGISHAMDDITATASDAVRIEEVELSQNPETHVFINGSDGSFSLEYAKDEEYFIGYGIDDETKLTYCMLEYHGAMWLVLAEGDSEYIGRYDINHLPKEAELSAFSDVSDDIFEITIYNNETEQEVITDAVCFTEEASLLSTGWSGSHYFLNGVMCRSQAVTVSGRVYYFDASGNYVKNQWIMLDGVNRFFNETGINSKSLYTTDYSNSKYHMMLRLFENNTWVWADHYLCDIDGVLYYFGANGKAVTDQWQTVDTVYRYFDANGINTSCYYTASYPDNKYSRTVTVLENNQWVQQKNCLFMINGKGYYFGSDAKMVTGKWITIDGVYRYFDASGVNSRSYYTVSYDNSKYWSMLRLFENNQWKWVTQGFYMINGKYYYFNNGKRYSGTGWISSGSTINYYIQQGVCGNRLVQSGNKYTYYQCVNGSWIPVTGGWAPVLNGVWYGFDSSGVAMRKYNTAQYSVLKEQGTVWDYTNGAWVQVKNTPVIIGNAYYCVTPTGSINRKQGWYTYSETKIVYVSADGKVTHYVNYFPTRGCSIYKTGSKLTTTSEGLKSVKINNQVAYYYSDQLGNCYSGTKIIEDYKYMFDQYGIAHTRSSANGLDWNFDQWMSRVCRQYLGASNIYCDEFVKYALAYAGNNIPTGNNTVRYTNLSTGGIMLNGGFSVSVWANGIVKGAAIVSENNQWKSSDIYVLNGDKSSFSYDELDQGDIIVYYEDGQPSHVSIFLGQFKNASEVKAYLVRLGISTSVAASCVKDWGAFYDNDATYWCIQGGMGSNKQVYICNSCYCIPDGSSNEYAMQIVNIGN